METITNLENQNNSISKGRLKLLILVLIILAVLIIVGGVYLYSVQTNKKTNQIINDTVTSSNSFSTNETNKSNDSQNSNSVAETQPSSETDSALNSQTVSNQTTSNNQSNLNNTSTSSVSPSSDNTKTPTDWKKYQNSQLGISFDYLENSYTENKSDNTTFNRTNITFTNKYLRAVIISNKDSDLSQNYLGMSFNKTVTVNGIKWGIVDGVFNSDSISDQTYAYQTTRNGYTFIFIFNEENIVSTIVDRIISSVTFF